MVIISTTMLEIKEVSRSAHRVYFFVLFGSQNNQRLFPYAALPDRLLGAFAKLRKANISFVISAVSLSVRKKLGYHLVDFHEI